MNKGEQKEEEEERQKYFTDVACRPDGCAALFPFLRLMNRGTHSFRKSDGE